jgi:hypothetical protein
MAAELSRGHITKILAHLFILAADVCVCVYVVRACYYLKTFLSWGKHPRLIALTQFSYLSPLFQLLYLSYILNQHYVFYNSLFPILIMCTLHEMLKWTRWILKSPTEREWLNIKARMLHCPEMLFYPRYKPEIISL